MAVIKLEDLVIAFQKTLGENKGYSDEDIQDLAEFVISLYGFDYAIVDNRLTPQNRDIFYKLEEEKLVYTRQEEVTIKKGKVWRLHYWFLNRSFILKLSRGKEEEEVIDEYAIYKEMNDDIWSRDEN